MNPGKSLKFMASTMNAVENMATPTSGNASLNFLTTFLSQPLWKINFSACTEVCLLVLKLWTTLGRSKEFKKFLMKDPCATYSGQILMIEQVGEWILEVQATLSAKTSLNNSTTQTTSRWSPVLISSWWRYDSFYSGIHQHPQQERLHHFLSSKLLLQMRKHGCHHGCRWEPQTNLHPIWPCSQKRKWSSEEESAWLFPLNPHFNIQRVSLSITIL